MRREGHEIYKDMSTISAIHLPLMVLYTTQQKTHIQRVSFGGEGKLPTYVRATRIWNSEWWMLVLADSSISREESCNGGKTNAKQYVFGGGIVYFCAMFVTRILGMLVAIDVDSVPIFYLFYFSFGLEFFLFFFLHSSAPLQLKADSDGIWWWSWWVSVADNTVKTHSHEHERTRVPGVSLSNNSQRRKRTKHCCCVLLLVSC